MNMLSGDSGSRRRLFGSCDFYFALLCLLFTVASFCALNDLCLYTPDSTRYLIWSKSLAFFDGFKDASAPEIQRYVMHSPFYSVLLAPAARLFPGNLLAGKIFTSAIGIGVLCLFYVWIGKGFGKWPALMGSFFLAINPLFLLFSTEILSDVPFALFFILSFILLDKIIRENDSRLSLLIGLALVISFGLLTREIGFSLLASVGLFFIFKKDIQKALFVFVVPVLLFFLWFVRNELLVAPVEAPSLTYFKIITHHFFTTSNTGLWEEYVSRISNNIVIYGKLVADLPFFPLYKTIQFDLVSRSSGSIALVSAVLEYGKYPLCISALCCGIAGIYIDYKQSQTMFVRLLFLICYIVILLCYPINDIRLLFPMLLLMVYYVAIGFWFLISRLLQRRPAMVYLVGVLLIVLFALPNIVWDSTLVNTNRAYREATSDSSDVQHMLSQLPSHYRTPFRLAGKWIMDHSDSSAIILSKWKEFACWIENRKLFSVDEMTSLDNFESLLRDYNVQYIVTTLGRHGWRDFEVPIDFTKRFSVTSVKRIGDLEILQVGRIGFPFAHHDTSEGVRRGLYVLDQRRYQEAEKIFSDSLAKHGFEISTLFYEAVAKEFGFKLEAARALFSQFRFMPLSVYLDDAAVHDEIIDLLLDAQRAQSGIERAEFYFRAAGGYWNLGFRSQARFVLRKSLQSDSTFSPAYVFGINFSLSEGDTAEARRYCQLAQRRLPDNSLLQTFSTILHQLDLLRTSTDAASSAQCALAISRAYQSIGLTENAIDYALMSSKSDSRNIEPSLLLTDLYESKQRYMPAMETLRKILMVDAQNVEARGRLNALLLHE